MCTLALALPLIVNMHIELRTIAATTSSILRRCRMIFACWKRRQTFPLPHHHCKWFVKLSDLTVVLVPFVLCRDARKHLFLALPALWVAGAIKPSLARRGKGWESYTFRVVCLITHTHVQQNIILKQSGDILEESLRVSEHKGINPVRRKLSS